MIIHHIGLAVTSKSEVNRFYETVLELTPDYQFRIEAPLARQIFSDSLQAVDVHMVKNETVALELFVHSDAQPPVLGHICFQVHNRRALVERARQGGYRVDVIPRENADLIFVFDHAQNRFEIKE